VVNSNSCPSCGRVGIKPNAGFCGRCGVKLPPASGGRRIWGTVLGSALGVLLIFWLISGLYSSYRSGTAAVGASPPATGGASDPATEPAPALPSFFPPKFEVALHRDIFHRNTRGEPPTTLKIVLTDEEPAAIQRVVLNGRAGEKGCDFTREDFVKGCLSAIESVADILGERCYGVDPSHPGDPRPSYTATEGVPCHGPAEASEIYGRERKSCVDSADEFPTGDPTWPQTLKTGDSITVDGDSCGDQIVNAKIITDRGEATYQFH